MATIVLLQSQKSLTFTGA